MSEGIGFGLVSPKSAPVDGDKDSARGSRLGNCDGKTSMAPTRSHLHPVLVLDTQLLGIMGMNLNKGTGMHVANFPNSTSSRLGVPIAAALVGSKSVIPLLLL